MTMTKSISHRYGSLNGPLLPVSGAHSMMGASQHLLPWKGRCAANDATCLTIAKTKKTGGQSAHTEAAIPAAEAHAPVRGEVRSWVSLRTRMVRLRNRGNGRDIN